MGGLERGRFLSTYNGSCEHLLAQEAAVAGMPWAFDIKPLLGTQRYHYKRRWGHRTERRLVPQLLEYLSGHLTQAERSKEHQGRYGCRVGSPRAAPAPTLRPCGHWA